MRSVALALFVAAVMFGQPVAPPPCTANRTANCTVTANSVGDITAGTTVYVPVGATEAQVRALLVNTSIQTLVFPYGTFYFTLSAITSTVPNVIGMGGANGATVFNVTGVPNTISPSYLWTPTNAGTIAGIKIQGTLANGGYAYYSTLKPADGSTVTDIWCDSLSNCIDFESRNHIRMRDIKATNIKSGSGLGGNGACALMGSFADASDIVGNGFYFDQVDRCVDLEDGITAVSLTGGYCSNASTYGLAVHGNCGAPQPGHPCSTTSGHDISFRDWYLSATPGLENSEGAGSVLFDKITLSGVVKVGSGAILTATVPNTTFRNITFTNSTLTAPLSFSLSGTNWLLDNVKSDIAVNVADGGSGGGGRIIGGSVSNASTSASSVAVGINASNVNVIGLQIPNITQSSGITISSGVSGVVINGLIANQDATNPGNYIIDDGGNGNTVENSVFGGTSQLAQIRAEGSGNGVYRHNKFTASKAGSNGQVWISSGSNNRVVDNIFADGKFTDSGTNNLWRGNVGYSSDADIRITTNPNIGAAFPAKWDNANPGQLLATTTSDTGVGVVVGVCMAGLGNAQLCPLAVQGQQLATMKLGTGTCSIGQYVIVDTTTDAYVKCTSSPTAGTVIGMAMSAQNTVGQTFSVRVGLK